MTNMKRSLSDSDSDGESYDDLKVGSPSQSCGAPGDRKKRRGVIEKRRRDRINNSLSELRRLVPTAYEKQGSAKLEKAEILQMTVDHLKVLHSKGLNGYNFDPATLAMDYRSVGFRECAAEVARYLVTAEGMDIQDPLRLRLMSHLQCYCAQREAAAKATLPNPLQTPSWSMPSHGLGSQYPPGGVGVGAGGPIGGVGPVGGVGSVPVGGVTSMPPAMISQHGNHTDQLGLSSHPQPSLPPPVSCHEPARLPTAMDSSNHMRESHMRDSHHMRLPHVSHVSTTPSQLTSQLTSQLPVSSTTSNPASSVLHSQLPGVHSQFFSMNSVAPMLSPGAQHYSQTSGLGQSSVKPYRPWGAELAY